MNALKRLTPVVVMVLAVVAGIVFARPRAERPDCPGKITCPQTGEVICRDQCPTVDPNRPDCPGRIVCPLTGELVCRDRCPAEQSDSPSTTAEAQPTCCSGKDRGGVDATVKPTD